MPGAFRATLDWQSGPRVLLADPAGGCFLGFGADNNGYGLGPGYWQADGDCTRTQSRPAPIGARTGFVALGNGQDDARQPTVGYTSPDGVVWTRDDGSGRSGMRGVRATVGLPDGTLLATTGTGANRDGRQAGNDDECAQAWRYAAGTWTA
jgi:hypothetical protein